MIIRSLELTDYRNYESLSISFGSGINILYGDNAQGKTNILEAIFLASTTKSHRGTKDKDIIRFGCDEGHLRTMILRDDVDTKIDIHLRNSRSKVIAIDSKRIKKATELLGLLKVVFFSPEDLNIIKNGPGERRRFTDMELCQLDDFYLYNLTNYNRIVDQRNTLLKDLYFNPSLKETIGIWDSQLVSFGSKIIERRKTFVDQLNEVIAPVHERLSGGRESLKIIYDPNVSIDDFDKELSNSTERDIKSKMTNVGPHRDDFIFMSGDLDIRRFGSQGQQRTAALSLKLAEIEIVKKLINDTPVLLLDDVLSELDSNRQNFLLDSIGEVQTIITCTGVEDFVNSRLKIDKLFEISGGKLISER